MKRNLKVAVMAFTMIGLMVSCSTSNNVASKRNIQKRKYTKGFYIDFGKKLGGNSQENEVVSTDVNPNKSDVVAYEEVVKTNNFTKEVVSVDNKAIEVIDPIQAITPEVVAVEKQANNIASNTRTIARVNTSASTKGDVKILKSDLKQLKKTVKKTKKENKSSGDAMLYYILAFFIPPVAVGLVTDWDIKLVLINLLLTALCGIPGIIHAFIVVKNNV